MSSPPVCSAGHATCQTCPSQSYAPLASVWRPLSKRTKKMGSTSLMFLMPLRQETGEMMAGSVCQWPLPSQAGLQERSFRIRDTPNLLGEAHVRGMKSGRRSSKTTQPQGHQHVLDDKRHLVSPRAQHPPSQCYSNKGQDPQPLLSAGHGVPGSFSKQHPSYHLGSLLRAGTVLRLNFNSRNLA